LWDITNFYKYLQNCHSTELYFRVLSYTSWLLYICCVLSKTVKNCADWFLLAWIFSCLVYFGCVIYLETNRYLLCDFWWFLEFTCLVAFITKVTARNICLHFVIHVLCHIGLCPLLFLVSRILHMPGKSQHDTRYRSVHKLIWHRT